MTTVAMGSSSQLNAEVLSMMHRFRKKVFIERLGWSLPTVNGQEQDSYDTSEARYVVMTDGLGCVTASARLLPTAGAYMLPDLFPQLLAGQAAPRNPALWELSRFATSVRHSRAGRVLSLSQQTLELLGLVFDAARHQGVRRLVFVTSIAIERLILRAGLVAHRVGPPAQVDGSLCVALFIDVPDRWAPAGASHAPPANGTGLNGESR